MDIFWKMCIIGYVGAMVIGLPLVHFSQLLLPCIIFGVTFMSFCIFLGLVWRDMETSVRKQSIKKEVSK
jgi:hypothetical protein